MAKKAAPGAAKPRDPEKDLRRLRKIVKDIRVAMLTTVEPDGTLRSRPMAVPKAGFDGCLWFLTKAPTAKTNEVQAHQRVNVSLADPGDGCFVSISGTAAVIRDREKVAAHWKRALREWFPEGKNDPDLALIRVDVDRAEYWDGGKVRTVPLTAFRRARASDRATAESRAEAAAASAAKGDTGGGGGAQG